MSKMLCMLAGLVIVCSLALAAEPDILLPANLQTIGCAAPDTKFMYVSGSQPGNVFYPDDPVNITMRVTRGEEPLKSVTLGIVEIATRRNEYLPGQSVMSPPPKIENLGTRGKIDVPITVEDKPGATADVEAKDIPVPTRYGTYVITVAPNGKDPQFLCTLLRAHKPKDGFDVDAPVFGEGQFLTHDNQKPELV